MKLLPVVIFFILILFAPASLRAFTSPTLRTDTVVIPFEFKQSAIYQQITNRLMDSVAEILLLNDSVTLSIDGYSHQDEGNDTITKYLSLNRALFVKSYILGRGIDTSRFISIVSYGKTRQLYRGTRNLGIGNCRAVIKLNYPTPPPKASDKDGDEIIDEIDGCPEIYGELINEGCPDSNIIIVPFATEASSLHAITYKVLDSVVTLLKYHPTYTISIEGHAYKTEGIRGVCEALAKDRAEMVKQYLLSRFILKSRIITVTSAGIKRRISAGRNPLEVAYNSRAEIRLNRN